MNCCAISLQYDAGSMRSAGLDVRLADTSFIPDDRLPEANYFQVALRRRVVVPERPLQDFSGCRGPGPMFWLYAAEGIKSVEQLAGKRIATFPPQCAAVLVQPHYRAQARDGP